MTATITTAELATALDTTPRTLRKFLRADAAANSTETPGKGKRYALPANARAIASMRKKFASWEDAQKVRNADAATETTDDADSDNDLAPSMIDNDAEPTESDLDDIDAE